MGTPLAERTLQRRSVVDTAEGHFHSYMVDGHEIFVDDDCQMFFDPHGLQPVHDEALVNMVTAQMLKDMNVHVARMKLAEKQSDGNDILAEALRWHLAFTGGAVQPLEKDGITFYQVGRNASHEFFVGFKDGQRYVLSVCCDWDEDLQEAVLEENVRAVDTWDNCYLGHL